MDFAGLILLGFSLFFYLLFKKGVFLFTAGVGFGLVIGAIWAAAILRSVF